MGLSKYQFNKIMRNYDRLQIDSEQIRSAREKELMETAPEYFETDKKIADNAMQFARAMFVMPSDEAEEKLAALRRDTERLGKRKTEILLSHGYPADYLEPVRHCKLCNDTGFVQGERCRCFKKAALELIYAQSNIQESIKQENFSSFRLDLYDDEKVDKRVNLTSREQMKKNYHTAVSFVTNFGNEYKNLLFYGHSGLGKTFLTNCIASELLKEGITVLYMTAHSLFDAFGKEIHTEDGIEPTEDTDYILNCDLLIIDDLGAELSNAFTISRLNLCINERLLNRKSTVISTNFTLPEIERTYGERNFSRIVGNYEPVYFFGDDIRLKSAMLK